MATLFFFDDFSAPDGTLLETYSSAWVRSTSTPNGIIDVFGGAARQQNTNTSVYANANSLAPTADYDVSANLVVVSGGGAPSVGICGRMAGTGAAPVTFYQVRLVNNSTGLVLARFVNGATATLLSMPLNYAAGANPKITLRMQGDQISALLDDVLVLGPVTDSSVTAAGYTGLRMASANTNQIRVDNLSSAPIEIAQPVQVSAAWTEQSETTTVALVARVQAVANWTEQNETTAVAGAVQVRATASWSEQGEVTAIVASVGPAPQEVALQAGWVEQNESITAVGAISVRAAAAWTEGSDAHSAFVFVQGGEGIDALLVPPRQTVVFEGSLRVVAFEGSKRVVSFEGSKRLVEFP